MEQRIVGVDARGNRVGEDHRLAVLTNAEVEVVRQLHETDGLTYEVLAEKFGVSKSTIAGICQYRRRAQLPVAWRVVRVPKGR